MKNLSKTIIFLCNAIPKGVIAFMLIVIAHHPSTAQSSDKLIKEGNKQYTQKKYMEAEVDYRKSLEKKDNPFIGNYNLGNAYYQQGKYEEAKQQYEIAGGIKSTSKENLESNYHNLGNALLKNKKYEESIQAYKEALKLNPSDNDTRYNLAYAKSMLQQQQQQQQKNDKNKDKDQQNKDQQQKNDKQKQDEQKKEQQQQKNEQAQQDEKKQGQQNPKDKISKEDAEKILQALNNEEKKTQKKLSVKEQTRVAIEKEW